MVFLESGEPAGANYAVCLRRADGPPCGSGKEMPVPFRLTGSGSSRGSRRREPRSFFCPRNGGAEGDQQRWAELEPGQPVLLGLVA